ncbi:hypothetical protein DCO58_11840 [Helicobacter saguini]|uniref:Uncharacterized protein n=1 Tax=Helicobacter saguini TaxID=1548018 RepID=A0A347VQA2_9HELI|nr:hypothetical protein [Helicobacter saguini]MWV61020.1 hypothetical protein [Helicobacter saguini]MWV68311.1 hypothetical protein [Helicobacter saguini]MWV70224.1 hypothetical protein [Helicobacter saguini]MWV72127.1 hypothetical protein [Helicobacter saguini]TLD91630.1 hypothetical protein LS64_011600 [Helicobacter saguini]
MGWYYEDVEQEIKATKCNLLKCINYILNNEYVRNTKNSFLDFKVLSAYELFRNDPRRLFYVYSHPYSEGLTLDMQGDAPQVIEFAKTPRDSKELKENIDIFVKRACELMKNRDLYFIKTCTKGRKW